MAQVTASRHPTRVIQLALPDENAIAGKSAEVFSHYGIDAEGIVRAVQEQLGK